VAASSGELKAQISILAVRGKGSGLGNKLGDFPGGSVVNNPPATKIYSGEKTISLNKWCWENWSTTCERMKLEHFLNTIHKKKPKWIKNVNVRP